MHLKPFIKIIKERFNIGHFSVTLIRCASEFSSVQSDIGCVESDVFSEVIN